MAATLPAPVRRSLIALSRLAFAGLFALVLALPAMAASKTKPVPDAAQPAGDKDAGDDAAAAPGPAQPPPAQTLAGNYRLTNADGDRVCPLTLLGTKLPNGRFGVDLDRKACGGAILFAADIAAWRPGVGDSILIETKQNKLIAEFTEGMGGIWEALREDDGVYFLVNPALAETAPGATPAELAGAWQLTRPADSTDRGAQCRLTLREQPAGGDTLSLTLDPECSALLGRFAAVSWRIDGGDILLLDAAGDRLRFAQQEDGGFSRVPEAERPLLLVRP
ncbi:protease inhibitor Inh/omp19 family protein [Ancylobacter sp. 6x-1]|uniref:Protease inhibitor Inh/omp19 family protein n=1 Tax=Ancylobacter crimeensis TaxID=2579147 RepID=A0ABT0DGR5_9HYPH|nr:protease inhibitor Inh/omp19 family protein [Ancylobacter crimeensis]MCK0198947.1 protease inhibitor Inh/omp19 family protein [Ancylobacter crimeensis]